MFLQAWRYTLKRIQQQDGGDPRHRHHPHHPQQGFGEHHPHHGFGEHHPHHQFTDDHHPLLQLLPGGVGTCVKHSSYLQWKHYVFLLQVKISQQMFVINPQHSIPYWKSFLLEFRLSYLANGKFPKFKFRLLLFFKISQ